MKVFVETPSGLGIQERTNVLGIGVKLQPRLIAEVSTNDLMKIRDKLVNSRALGDGYYWVQEELDIRDGLIPRL